MGLNSSALKIYERIMEMRPWDPLYLWLSANNKCLFSYTEESKSIYKMYYDSLFLNVDKTFYLSESIILTDFIDFMNKINQNNISLNISQDDIFICPIKENLSLDIRIVIIWNKRANVELIIIEPDGEICTSMKNMTKNGGLMSNDSTYFGPQEYLLKNACSGRYIVQVKLFTKYDPLPSIDVLTIIYTDFGKDSSNQFIKVRTLKKEKSIKTIGFIDVR